MAGRRSLGRWASGNPRSDDDRPWRPAQRENAESQFNATVIHERPKRDGRWTWSANVSGHAAVSSSRAGGIPDSQTPLPLTGAPQSFNQPFAAAGVFVLRSIHALRTDADPVNVDASITLGKMVGKITAYAPPSVDGIAMKPEAPILGASSGTIHSRMRMPPVIAGLGAILWIGLEGTAHWFVMRRRVHSSYVKLI